MFPYASTLEGQVVTYRCLKITNDHHFEEYNVTAVCAKTGRWEPNYEDICEYPSGKHSNYITAHLYTSPVLLIIPSQLSL